MKRRYKNTNQVLLGAISRNTERLALLWLCGGCLEDCALYYVVGYCHDWQSVNSPSIAKIGFKSDIEFR